MPTLESLGRIAVVSPHLDDAVFACGQLIAAHPGATVITVFAGVPSPGVPLTEWDRRSGFRAGDEAMRARRKEDGVALSLLQARPVWLDHLDRQYGEAQSPDEVAVALQQRLQQVAPETVLWPLGLFHSDHLLVHEAAARAALTLPGVRRMVYEDALYRGISGLLQQRLMALAQEGVCLTPARVRAKGPPDAKASAVQAYASQVGAFGPKGYDDTWAPERCWLYEPGGPV